jgi:hypothetical protein
MSNFLALAGLAAQVGLLSVIGLNNGVGQVPGRAPRPTVEFEVETLQVTERPGTISVRVELSEPAPRMLAIPFSLGGTATRGEDYVISGSPVIISRGMKSANIFIDILQDLDDDDDGETIELTLNPPRGDLAGGTFGRILIRVLNPKLGDPINGLTVAQFAAFNRGFEVFTRRFKPSTGLGPFYNATSCASCHSTPVVGGGSGLYRNFYLAVYQFGPTTASQSSSIPPFLSAVVPAFGSGDEHPTTTEFTLEGGRPLMPDTVFGFPVLSAQRNAIPVFGVGLFENISDTTILSNADPFDLNGDGISGVANTQLMGAAVGRLGLKAQANNIELFTRGPLQNQMGITSDPFEGSDGLVSMTCSPLFQVAADPNDPSTDFDPVADPEINTQDLGDLIAYGKFLAPPPPPVFNGGGVRGKELFTVIGCVTCHIPSLPSSKGAVKAYTDLLLHDMGPILADNIKLGDAVSSTNEFRTQPLWGVSEFPPFLHDGRAATILEAVLLHAGEAQGTLDEFNALTPLNQQNIIDFLEQL